MTEREKFEEWARDKGFALFKVDGEYEFTVVRDVGDAWQASRRAALEEAGAFMDKRADELDACGNHTASTMARIYRDEAASIRSLATGDKA